MHHQLHATIKPASKYALQNEWVGGKPFPVEIEPEGPGDYIVAGGPGGRYRLEDLNFWVIVDGHQVPLSCASPAAPALEPVTEAAQRLLAVLDARLGPGVSGGLSVVPGDEGVVRDAIDDLRTELRDRS